MPPALTTYVGQVLVQARYDGVNLIVIKESNIIADLSNAMLNQTQSYGSKATFTNHMGLGSDTSLHHAFE